MPWRIERRDGRYCVIKESDGSSAGCHDARTDAIKQQRALYANESRMASIYEELDEQEPEMVNDFVVASDADVVRMVDKPSELVKIEIGKENEALTASVLSQMERMSERQAQTDAALIAALQTIGARESVVNVSTPEVTVENVVEPTPVTIENKMDTPEVTVRPEINVSVPRSSKTVTLERDPLTREVTKAEVTET